MKLYLTRFFELEEDFFDDTDFTNELIAFSTLAITCILLWMVTFR